MKPRHCLALALATVAASCLSPLTAATETPVFKTQISIYVFKNADFHDFQSESATFVKKDERDSRWMILTSPTTLRFDRLVLSLTGEKYTWSDEAAVARKFSLLSAPTVITRAGQKAALSISSPTQYFEKQADGSFRLVELAKDSPTSPHCTLTVLAQPAGAAADRLALTFAADIVALGAREKIPGVDLDIGRPVLVTIKDEQTFTAPAGAWTALLCQAPGGGDYSLLLLLKVSAQPPK